MEERVFSKKEFFSATQDDFILLTLDYQDGQDLPDEVVARREQLNDLYKYPPTPTIFFADAQGRPFDVAEITADLEPWLRQVKNAKERRVEFDRVMKELNGGDNEGLALEQLEALVGLEILTRYHDGMLERLRGDEEQLAHPTLKRVEAFLGFESLIFDLDLLVEDGEFNEIRTRARSLSQNENLEIEKRQKSYELIGHVAYEEGHPDEAKRSFEKAISLDPETESAEKLRDLMKQLAAEVE